MATKVTSRVLAADAVTRAMLGDDAIGSAEIADDVALGGNPTTTTQATSNSTTRIATTAFVQAAVDADISSLIDSAPGTLNTLNEIAAALNDDPSFTTTVNNAIALKSPIASPTFTGTVTLPATVSSTITPASDSTYALGSDSVRFAAGYLDGVTVTNNITAGGTITASGALTASSVTTTAGFLGGSNGGIRIHSGGTKFFNITAANAAQDATMDVGASDARFKDLYLSGKANVSQLDINAASTADTVLLTRGTTSHNNMLKFKTGSSDKWIVGQRNDTTDHFRFYSYGTSSDVLSILTDGKVGIGTASPASLLNLRTASAASYPILIEGDIDNDGGYTGIQFGYNGSNYNKAAIHVEGTSGNVQPEIHFLLNSAASSANTNTLTDAKMSIINNGNVGIGTTTPSENLMVHSATAGDHTRVHITKSANAGSAGVSFNSYTPSNVWTIFQEDASAGKLFFYDGADYNVTMQTDGKVGIGTTGPGYTLDTKASTATDNRTIARFEGVGIAGSQAAGGQYVSIMRSGAISNSADNISGGLLLGIASSVLSANCGIRGTYEYTNGRDLEFFTSSDNTSAPTTKMVIKGDGKVGIGTTSPTLKLDVEESSSTWIADFVNTNATPYGLRIQCQGNTAGTSLVFGAYTSGGAGVFINNNGKLGIGITDPVGKLHVQGLTSGVNFHVDDSTGYGIYVASQNALNFNYGRNETSTGYINFRGYQDGASQFRNLNIGDGKQGTTAFFNGVNGYVDFLGAADIRITLGSTGTAGTNTANWIRGQGSDVGYNAASGAHKWEIGGTENMRLDASPSASVGHLQLKDNFPWIDMIAPDSGTFKAGITARGGSSSTQAQFHLHVARDASYKKISTALDYDTYLTTDTSSNNFGNLIFGTRLAERMRIDVNGNVGIGRTSPASILHIHAVQPEVIISNDTQDGTSTMLRLCEDYDVDARAGGYLHYNGSANVFIIGTHIGGTDYPAMAFERGGNRRVSIGATNAYNSHGYPAYPAAKFATFETVADIYAATFRHDGNANSDKGIAIICGPNSASGTTTAINIIDGDGSSQGEVTFSGGTVSYGAFTANHDVELPEADNDSGYTYGTLVETTEIFYKQKDGADSERGIQYKVQKSQSANSKAVLGAYGNKYSDKDNLHQVSILGDGHILCKNEGGDIAIGDGICTSSVKGIGMKATANPSMIIGIAQEAVTFSNGSERKLVVVQFGLQQFTPWSN